MKNKEIISFISERLGIETLNPMQLAVMSARKNHIILLAPTGSGKTVAFTIAVLQRLEPACGAIQALVIAPSRELVIQISDVVRRVAVGYKTVAFYGGHPMQTEVDSIKGAVPDIIVATPGRLVDHLKRNTLSLERLRGIVFDEYDKSLELGFLDEIKRIVARLPRRLSLTMLTSATPISELPPFIDMTDAEIIDYVARTESPRERMDVVNVISPDRDKLETLASLLLTLRPGAKTIVFINHRESAERVYEYLRRLRFPAGLYHGGLEQRDREQAVDLLNNGTTPILVSTDLASRGLDIDAVEAVIHYHHAPTVEAWTHRNGRTARIDASGTVYVITAEGENLPEFEVYDRDFRPAPRQTAPVPSAVATLYINAGKREKISRGDVAGYLMQCGGLTRDEVGRIVVKDHSSLVAIPSDKISVTLSALQGQKLKKKTVRVSVVKP